MAKTVVTTPTKSVGTAVFLTVLFGPIGMLYADVVSGFLMLIITVILAFFTDGISLILTIPISILWTISDVNSYNKKLYEAAEEDD